MLLAFIFLCAVVWALLSRFRSCPLDAKPLVQVVVLGDIGHSPRMQYHALSLVDTGKVCVEFIGFGGSKPLAALLSNANVRIRTLRRLQLPESWRVPFVIYAVLKVIFESVQLVLVLVSTKYRPECILLQTPPAVPATIICGLVSKLSGSKLVLDFHNITYMHLGSKLSNKRIISLVRSYEEWTARIFCHSALCVTKGMKSFLETDFHLTCPVHTLYDRPGPQFQGRTSPLAKSDLEHRLTSLGIMKKKFTDYDFVIVSSTSWTQDEDFSLLLKALPEYSSKSASQKTLLFITGKGEMKDKFVSAFFNLNLANIDLVTAWVPSADYPLILGSADIGISVHTSTSGLDLPMKVVDMLGSVTPVVALKFPALIELLTDNGLVFSTPGELAHSLLSLTVDEGAKERRGQLSKSASKFRQSTWKSEWTATAWPVFERLLPKRSRQSRRRI